MIFNLSAAYSFIESMLETHLIHTLKVDEVEVAIFFVIYGCFYFVFSIAVGKVVAIL